MAEIIRFEFNVPEEIALKYATGREVEGRYGPQMMYSLTDDRVMYLDLSLASRLTQMGIGAGERFTITKKETRGDGRKRGVEWVIQRVDPPQTQRAGDAGTSPAPLAVTAPKALQNDQTSPENNSLGDFIRYNTTILTGVLCASIDALDNAARYGASKNFELHFNEEDVRAMASTLYIQASRGAQWTSR